MKRRTPYDFVAITDHSEYYGVLKEFANPKSPLSKSELAKNILKGQSDPVAAKAAVTKLIGSVRWFIRWGWLDLGKARAMREWHNDGSFSLDTAVRTATRATPPCLPARSSTHTFRPR